MKFCRLIFDFYLIFHTHLYAVQFYIHFSLIKRALVLPLLNLVTQENLLALPLLPECHVIFTEGVRVYNEILLNE